MSESDVAELCRKIYKQHRQAIDLIYEHRPGFRSEIEEFIGQMIQDDAKNANLEKDDSTQLWIRFSPKEWDESDCQKVCEKWTNSLRILLFEFWNESQSLKLRLVIGPGEKQTKLAIYEKLQELNIAGFKKLRANQLAGIEQKWSFVFEKQILDSSDYEDEDLEGLQEKIKVFWDKFINGDLKTIREAVVNAFTCQLPSDNDSTS